MANWINKNGLWTNTPNICQMKVQFDFNNSYFAIYYSFDGVNWSEDTADQYATEALAQTALNNFAATLG